MNDLNFVEQIIMDREQMIVKANDAIYDFAEIAYQETQSAALLCRILEEEGFTVETGVCGIPTAFTGTYGSGKPVIGILGEFDALPTLSQKAGCPEKSPVAEGAPGHGCGHSALGTAALAAAIAVKEYLKATGHPGTVIYYGCAAEENCGAKTFMARAGLFEGVDAVYTWHPGNKNGVCATRNIAVMGVNFEFHGITSHAGGSPHLGRSALDATELMNVGVNYLREHMVSNARIHYAYVDAGGTAANVVQEHTLIKYVIRAPKVTAMMDLYRRVVNVAKGAALMTDTTVDHKITMAYSDYIPNNTLARVADQCFQEIGAPAWDEDDYRLARQFLNTYNDTTLAAIKETITDMYGADQLEEKLKKPLDTLVPPYDTRDNKYMTGSTDVGDVGYAAPTLNISVATACLGNVGHTWQMAGQTASSIGRKGLLTAAKVMALASIRTLESPEIIKAAHDEFMQRNGGVYDCPLPEDMVPPVNCI